MSGLWRGPRAGERLETRSRQRAPAPVQRGRIGGVGDCRLAEHELAREAAAHRCRVQHRKRRVLAAGARGGASLPGVDGSASHAAAPSTRSGGGATAAAAAANSRTWHAAV